MSSASNHRARLRNSIREYSLESNIIRKSSNFDHASEQAERHGGIS
jgi:hypothetical protein